MTKFVEINIVINEPEEAKAKIAAASAAIKKAMNTEPVLEIKKLQSEEMSLIDALAEQIEELVAPHLECLQQSLESAGFTVLISVPD